jgi:monoamine oxidase
MVMIRVQGYGGIIGPGGNLGGPGLLKLFDFGGTFGE